MTIMTYDAATPASDVKSAAARKSIFRRFLDALYESRLRQARREINRHLYLIPSDTLRQAGYKASVKSDGALPFGR